MKEWFQFKNAPGNDDTVAEVHIFGFIGDWIDDFLGQAGRDGVTTAKSFVDELSKLPATVKTLRVRLNSPGGDVFGAVTIANALRAQQARGVRVETVVEGLAASAASIVAMGGAPIRMADNALMMVHHPWGGLMGNAAEMRAYADLLDQIADTLVKTYQWHSELDSARILAMLDGPDGQGTWMDAAEAIEAGFADEVIEGLQVAAAIDPKAAAKLKVPEKYAGRVAAMLAPAAPPAPAPVPDPPAIEDVVPVAAKPGPAAVFADAVVRAVAAAGLDLAFACALLEGGSEIEAPALEARITEEVGRRAAAAARDRDIRALCHLAGQDDLADGYVAGGMTVDQVRAHVAAIRAKLDRVEVDGHIDPERTAGRGAGAQIIDVAALYAKRNNPGAGKAS